MKENLDQVLLTFVVPCYNVEKYIQRCLDSIYACGLHESRFEVLCVNDCSPDNVQDILERNRERHDNLRIVAHEKNMGLGGARNTGIHEAKGKYLWFVDSDDLVTAHGIEPLMQKAVEQDLDVLCFNYRRVDEDGKELSRHIVFENTSSQNGNAFVKSVFGTRIVNHMGYVWRFIYKKEFLWQHQLFFPEHVRWEDTVFMPKALLEAGRVAAVPNVLYSYRVNADSISGTFGSSYPASSIYEFAFCAGGNLLKLSEEIRDKELGAAFRDVAIQKYINGVALFLFRTSKRERKRFFELIKEREEEVKPLKQYLNLLNKVMFAPLVGPMATNLMSRVYKMKQLKTIKNI